MCAIFGAVLGASTPLATARVNRTIDYIMHKSRERGRDGWGYRIAEEGINRTGALYDRKGIVRGGLWPDNQFFGSFYPLAAGTMIGNMRAEPTTEYVEHKKEYDQQPYRIGKWTIVHNGTIANDKDLRHRPEGESWLGLATDIDSGVIVELLGVKQTFDSIIGLTEHFKECISKLKGSYAILATHDDHRELVLAACNYRPIWFAKTEFGTFFASARDYFLEDFAPQMVEPYSIWAFTAYGRIRLDNPLESKGRALVVCSGGMDSVVSAAAMLEAGFDVHLLHYTYGSRAQSPELEAIRKVAAFFGVGLTIAPMNIYDPADSPLLQADSAIAGGEEGAEFAHEWVPARNLVMLALTTAMAEAKGFDTIVLGNNLEEAGAYPDNEPEFINRFNDMLPFAVGDGKRVRVVMPVGNLMKHEIVALGEQLGAPMHLTWSCYRAGEHHCGKCGPCYMRKTAYAINELTDPLTYAKD